MHVSGALRAQLVDVQFKHVFLSCTDRLVSNRLQMRLSIRSHNNFGQQVCRQRDVRHLVKISRLVATVHGLILPGLALYGTKDLIRCF